MSESDFRSRFFLVAKNNLGKLIMSFEFLKDTGKRWIQSIRMSVSPVPKRLLEGAEDLTELPGSDQRPIWVPARRTLKHASFEVPGQLTGRKRMAALDLKISAWSPYQETGYAVQWSGHKASVYAWDAAMLRERLAEHGYKLADVDIVPPAFLQEPRSAGIRLIEVPDGYEGQVWQSGHLQITRWWKALPTAQEWSLFQRGAGQFGDDSDSGTVSPHKLAWLERPWTSSNTSADFLSQVIGNRNAMAWVTAATLIPCVFLIAQWLTYYVYSQAVSRSIASIEQTSLQVRQQRSEALFALSSVEDFQSLRRFPDQIEIVSAAHSIIRQFPVTLSNWDYDEGELEFGLESDENMDARVFITAFENAAMFSQVSASTRGERILLRMIVAPVSAGML